MTFSAVAGRAGEPNDPLLRLSWAATALRQHPGDPHAAALLTAEISPCEAPVLAAAGRALGVSPGVGGPPFPALDQPHVQRSARHRQQQSAGATQQQRAHQPAQERATDPHDPRRTDLRAATGSTRRTSSSGCASSAAPNASGCVTVRT